MREDIERLRKEAREELRREYEALRDAKVELWQKGKPLSQARKDAR